MAYARITMTEATSAEELGAGEEAYKLIREEVFPGIQMTINVRTGPKSLLSLSVYPDQETAEATLEGRKQHIEDRDYVKDTFYYEGEVSFWKID
jgi:hypothetical protein